MPFQLSMEQNTVNSYGKVLVVCSITQFNVERSIYMHHIVHLNFRQQPCSHVLIIASLSTSCFYFGLEIKFQSTK